MTSNVPKNENGLMNMDAVLGLQTSGKRGPTIAEYRDQEIQKKKAGGGKKKKNNYPASENPNLKRNKSKASSRGYKSRGGPEGAKPRTIQKGFKQRL